MLVSPEGLPLYPRDDLGSSDGAAVYNAVIVYLTNEVYQYPDAVEPYLIVVRLQVHNSLQPNEYSYVVGNLVSRTGTTSSR